MLLLHASALLLLHTPQTACTHLARELCHDAELLHVCQHALKLHLGAAYGQVLLHVGSIALRHGRQRSARVHRAPQTATALLRAAV